MNNVAALHALARIAIRRGDHAEGIGRLQRAVGLAPRRAELRLALAWVLATAPRAADRDGVQAEAIAREVRDALLERPDAADTLAAALAELGRFDEAVAEAERALRLAREHQLPATARAVEQRLESYRRSRPHRE